MDIIEITTLKNFQTFIKKNKTKVLLVYFYCEQYNELNSKIIKYIKEQYNSNIIFTQINIKKSNDIVKELDITTYPIIRIYNDELFIKEVYIEIENCEEVLNKIYKS